MIRDDRGLCDVSFSCSSLSGPGHSRRITWVEEEVALPKNWQILLGSQEVLSYGTLTVTLISSPCTASLKFLSLPFTSITVGLGPLICITVSELITAVLTLALVLPGRTAARQPTWAAETTQLETIRARLNSIIGRIIESKNTGKIKASSTVAAPSLDLSLRPFDTSNSFWRKHCRRKYGQRLRKRLLVFFILIQLAAVFIDTYV